MSYEYNERKSFKSLAQKSGVNSQKLILPVLRLSSYNIVSSMSKCMPICMRYNGLMFMTLLTFREYYISVAIHVLVLFYEEHGQLISRETEGPE